MLEITFDKDILNKAIRWVVSIIDPKDDAAMVRMNVNTGDGTVNFSSQSMEGERSIDVTADIEDGDEVNAPLYLMASALKKVPAQVTTDQVTFTYSDKDATNLKVKGGVRLSVRVSNPTFKDVRGVKDMTQVGSIVPADLFNSVKMLYIIADKSADDLLFTCIDFDANGSTGILRLMSIDGAVMMTRDLEFEPADDEDHRFLLTAETVKSMSSAVDATSVDLFVDSSAVTFVFDDGRTSRVNQFKADAPNYEVLIYRDRDDETFTVNRADLQNAVNKLTSWNADDDLTLILKPDEEVMTVRSINGDWSTDLILPENTLNDEFEVIFPKVELMKALRSSDRDLLRGRFVRDAEAQEKAFTWDQLRNDGEADDTVYLMSLPMIPNDDDDDWDE